MIQAGPSSVNFIAILLCLAFANSQNVATAASAPIFRVTDLGTFGAPTGAGHDINAQGWVVGLSGDHGFLYDGTLHDLGAFDPGSINESGLMTGNTDHVYRFDGALRSVGTLADGVNGIGGINNRGQVAGTHTRPDGGVYATLSDFNGHTFQDLGALGGGFSSAEGISDQGIVVGRAFPTGSGLQHAFMYDGVMHDLGTLGGTESAATDVNAAGLITGWSRTATGGYRAFLYDAEMRSLGTLGGNSFAHSINNARQITGRSFTTRGEEHAFLYDPRHGMRDLNTLVDPQSGWVLLASTGINDAGMITGVGTIGGERRPFLLTPIPEPSSSGGLLLCLALATAAERGRKRRYRSRFIACE